MGGGVKLGEFLSIWCFRLKNKNCNFPTFKIPCQKSPKTPIDHNNKRFSKGKKCCHKQVNMHTDIERNQQQIERSQRYRILGSRIMMISRIPNIRLCLVFFIRFRKSNQFCKRIRGWVEVDFVGFQVLKKGTCRSLLSRKKCGQSNPLKTIITTQHSQYQCTNNVILRRGWWTVLGHFGCDNCQEFFF